MKTFNKSCKILSLLLALCMVCTFWPITASAEEENTTSFEITVNSDGTTCTITGFKEDCTPTETTDVEFPETIAGYTVTAIGASAFANITTFGTVTFPDTLKTIGNSAFSYCTGITISNWPQSLEKIDWLAFKDAKSGAINADFSNTKLKTLDGYAFAYSSLKTIVLPDTVTTIGANAFEWTSITELVIPNSVTSLGDKVVRNCGSLAKIRFPKNSSITEIPANTFDATGSTFKTDMKIYIPSNITTIPSGLFDKFNTGIAVTIYGEAGSAAETFYETSKEGLDDLTIGSIAWMEHDFVNDISFSYDDTGIYNGSSDLSFTAGTEEYPAAVKKAEGVYGKLAEDTVYKIDAQIGHSGYNYIPGKGSTLDTAVFEFAVALPSNAPELRLTFQPYTSADKDKASTSPYLSIKDGAVSVNNAFSNDGSSSLCTVKEEQWTSIALVIPGYNQLGEDAYSNYANGEDTYKYYVYVNGEKYEVPLSTPIYGTHFMRLHPQVYPAADSAKTYYIDNFRAYTSADEHYTSSKDTMPAVNFGSVDMSGSTVNLDEGTTVAEFEAMIDTSANVRVYSDDSYETQLTDDEEIPYGAVIVFATNNRRTTERAYSYYSYSEVTYDETGLYDGTKDLSITAGDGNENPSVVTKVSGVYGKDFSDTVYKVDTYGGHAGWNYIGIAHSTLDYETMEISFAMSDNAPDMIFALGAYTSTDTSTFTSGTILTLTSGGVYSGTATLIDSASRSRKLCEIEPEQWNTIAVVLPGYNQLGEATEKFYVYVNGTEYEIPFATSVYGTKYLRFAPSATYKEEKTIYFDNYRTYRGADEYYTKAKDALPVVDLSGVDVLDGNINIAENTTVAEFKEMIPTKATVRVFTNDKYSAVLEDSDILSAGNMVVFATNNKRTTERTYSYYSVNRPLVISKITVVNEDGKAIKGTSADIKNIGEAYYLETTVTNKTVSATVALNAILASYDKNDKMIDSLETAISIAPGVTKITPDENAVKFEGLEVSEGCTLKAFLWVDDSNEPTCGEYSTVFDGREEYHILMFANSYGADSFEYLPEIAAADDIDIYAVNMYRGGCSLAMHYNYMNGNGTYESRNEYTPDGKITTKNASFADGINTYGYSWDVVALQAASHGMSSNDFSFIDYDTWTDDGTGITTGVMGITTKDLYNAFNDYVNEYAPNAKHIMHMSWSPCESESRTMYNSRFADEEEYPSARDAVFEAQKAAYEYASTIYSDEAGMMVPTSYAVWYALNELGFLEHSGEATDGVYSNPNEGEVSIYRDETCHLTFTYGRVLAGLTWYEYITGNDVRENLYQNSSIDSEVMAKLKEAAHYANTMVVPITGSAK